jgi:hypothetical protein
MTYVVYHEMRRSSGLIFNAMLTTRIVQQEDQKITHMFTLLSSDLHAIAQQQTKITHTAVQAAKL